MAVRADKERNRVLPTDHKETKVIVKTRKIKSICYRKSSDSKRKMFYFSKRLSQKRRNHYVWNCWIEWEKFSYGSAFRFVGIIRISWI